MTMTEEEIKMWNKAKEERKWYECRFHTIKSKNDSRVNDSVLFPTEKDRIDHEKLMHLGYGYRLVF